MRKTILTLLLIAAAATVASAQSATNFLVNPGFEIGYSGQRMMDAINSWPPETYPVWDWGRIRSAATTPTHSGTNTFELDAFANYNKVMAQRFKASAGIVYEVEAWMKSPSNSAYFKPTNGFCYAKIEFFNAAGASIGAEDSIAKFRQNGPTNWTIFTTGPVQAPANTVTGKAMFGYCPGGDDWQPIGDVTTVGYVYVDDLRAFTNLDHNAGVMSNAGFEVRNGTTYLPLTNMPFWTGLGTDGGGVTNHHRTGQISLQIWGIDSLAGQTWAATRSNKYATSAYIFSTNFTTTNAYAQVILQFLNATNGVIVEYASPRFTSQSPSNTWTQFEAVGVAPSGTVVGRTLCGIVGDPTGFGTSTAWFDDTTQRVVSTTGTMAGLIHNGGFDDGPSGNAYDLALAGDLPWWEWLGGDNGGFVNGSYKTNEQQSLSITYPDNSAGQKFAAVTGRGYIVEGYIYNPAAEDLTGSAFGAYLIEFYRGTSLVSTIDSSHFTSASPADSWVKFAVTNRAPWTGSVTGRVVCGIYGDPTGFGGALYFDGVRVTETNLPQLTNAQAGAIWNPGFEYTARGTVIGQMDSWSADGASGLVGDSYKRSGNNALQLYYPGTLAHQTWDATQGWRYASSAFAFTPSADRLAGASTLHGVVLLQFLDATGTNVLQTYESTWFTTGNVADAWTALQVNGTAPSGTRYGRTTLALLGDTAGYDGSLWFDDATQLVVSTTGTVAGLLHNPGFDDGPPGNAYDLGLAFDLPYWDWLGGTNGGYITTSYKLDDAQSLVITWPGNLIGQSFNVVTGQTYVYQGYMYTPSSDRMTGTAYGVLQMEFYDGAELVSVSESAHFTAASPSNSWVKFAVTNRAPWTGTISSRVLCSIAGSSASFGGALYFDGLSVTGRYIGATNVQAGTLWNPGFEYTAPGTALGFIENWTALGNAGVIAETYKRSGKNALQLYAPETLLAQTWDATQGWKYASAAYAYTPVADKLQGDPDLHGIVLLQFLDATGTNILQSYESAWFRTNWTAGAWSNLEAIGVAPKGTRYGRTVLGLLGTNLGFSGSIWFDDATQRVVSTTGTTNGLLHNAGFDDGPTGNAYDLYATNDFPYWVWIGGTNAGFVGRDYKKNEEQALVITYPLNSAAQDWTAGSGKRYKAEGYLLTPSTAKFNSDGDMSFGRLELAFYVNGSGTPETNFVTAAFGASQPADTWTYFAVTGRAPAGVSVTGRVTCTIYSSDPENDADLAGVIYFDQLAVNELTNTFSSDLALTKTGSPAQPRVGGTLTYSLAVSNKGPDAAEGVMLSDLLPAEVNFSTCSVSQGSWSFGDGEVACSLGTLANGATAGVTIVVTPTLDGWITNTASVSSDSSDAVTANNRAEAATQVLAANRTPEITLPGPHTMTVGRSTNFVVTVSDADHDSVTLTNTVKPTGATFVTSNFSWTATAAFAGTTNLVVFVANDGQGLTNSVVTNSTTITVLFDSDTDGMSDGWEWTQFGNLTNSGSADNDGDTENNYREYVANTQPTNAQSYFRFRDLTTAVGTSNHQVRVYTEPQRKYSIYYSTGALSNNVSWTPFANTNWGVWLETASSSTNHIFTDNESTNTGGPLSSGARRYYRVKVSFP